MAHRLDRAPGSRVPGQHVLLLPPRDAYLLGHRPFLAPDRALAKEVWRPIGSPGVLVVGGEVAGTWRARKSGKALALTVSPQGKLTAAQRKRLDEQAGVGRRRA
jgi:hypothetical protein